MDTMIRFNTANLLMWSLSLQVNNGKAQMPAWKTVLEPEVWPCLPGHLPMCHMRAFVSIPHGVQHGSRI